MTPQRLKLKGSGTTITGILAIIGGALGLFTQMMAAWHGTAMDQTATATSLGTIGAGAGLLKAADQQQ